MLRDYVVQLQHQKDEINDTEIVGVNRHLELTNVNDDDSTSSSEMNVDLDSFNNCLMINNKVYFQRSNDMDALIKHW